ncbi:MAG: PAS domain-containing sensor histidine kinase, partial [Romboutsia sp.]
YCIIDKIIYLYEDIYTLNINNNFSDSTYLICLNNITKEIKMEEELKNIGEEYEYIIENIPCTIMLRTSGDILERNNIVSVNKSFENLFGYSKEELKGLNVLEYYNKINLEFLDGKNYNKLNLTIEEKIKNIQSNAQSYNLISATIKDKENLNINMEITVDDYIDNGDSQKILILKDMTEEISTYININNQSKLYRKVLDSVPEGIIIELAKTREIIYTNKKFKKIFAIKGNTEEIESLSKKYRYRLETKFLHNLHNGEKDKSIYIVNEDKKIKEIKVLTKTWYMGDKRFRVKLIEDLDEQREAERIKEILIRQREYDKLKMEFYANMSHELKTPLNNIYSSTQLIEILYKQNKVVDTNGEIGKHIRIVKQNMLRLVRLIDNIINVSQVKSEIYKIKSVNFDIVYLIEEIVSSVQQYAQSKDLNLIFDTNEEILLVGLDPETIERIVLNLLSNSIKFTKDKGKILVGVYKIDNKVQIIVKDTGIGIDKNKLSDIFDRFKQIEDGGVSNEFGSGIGLYLSKSLVEVQEGNVDIKSEINKGTEIIVEFPIKEVKENNEHIVEYSGNIEKFKIEFFDIYK